MTPEHPPFYSLENDPSYRDLQRLISARQVCELFNISVASLYRKVATGELPPPIKIGRMSRWRLSELQATLDRAGRGLTDMSVVVAAQRKAARKQTSTK